MKGNILYVFIMSYASDFTPHYDLTQKMIFQFLQIFKFEFIDEKASSEYDS
jgi:hypothetical protein